MQQNFHGPLLPEAACAFKQCFAGFINLLVVTLSIVAMHPHRGDVLL
jgi:hypothetical protein